MHAGLFLYTPFSVFTKLRRPDSSPQRTIITVRTRPRDSDHSARTKSEIHLFMLDTQSVLAARSRRRILVAETLARSILILIPTRGLGSGATATTRHLLSRRSELGRVGVGGARRRHREHVQESWYTPLMCTRRRRQTRHVLTTHLTSRQRGG